MNPKIKISQLPAKGSNLAAADLLEVAEFTGTGYISKSITGQEIIDAAVGNVDWGDIGGTLSAQTDLNTALSGKVPTTRTLTINGTTQDLSADRTFTISTGITIGTTAITSGTVGRVLFEGTGNVVQESSSFTYDDTLKVFTITGPIGSVLQHTALTNYNGLGGFQLNASGGTERGFFKLNPTTGEVRIGATGSGYFPTFYAQGVEAMRIFASTRNIGVNTTTDAGFKLDVNGTARVVGQATIQTLTVGLGGGAIASNTALGYQALQLNSTGVRNIGVGYQANYTNSTGLDNTAIGHNALFSNTANHNTAVGSSALNANTTANHNTAVGRNAMVSNTTGGQNTGIGRDAISANTTGSDNSALGYQTASGNFSGSTILGRGATATANNQFVVGSTGTVAGAVTTEVNTSTQVWNVIINGVARKILLA